MAHLLHVDESDSAVCGRTSMTALGLTETRHLEQWITDHPEVLDDSLKVVTTQFRSWASDTGTAKERPDVLALSTTGELVVVELKRDEDRRIHLQAITYGALASQFTKETLAAAHRAWMCSRGHEMTDDEAMAALEEHLEAGWDEELFLLPRLVLVAETFTGQVLSTVTWLGRIAPELTIECHEYHLFQDDGRTLVSFQRIFPVDDLESRRLRPALTAEGNDVGAQVATNRRRTKSVTIISRASLIPDGAALTLELAGLVRPDVVADVNTWLDEDPQRRAVTWRSDPTRPLVWAVEPGETWTPSRLRNEIFERAGITDHRFSAADAWYYEGQSLYWIAQNSLDAE